jgi:hypothetical protein
VLESKREGLQTLTLERPARRELKKLDDEDAEAERRRAAMVQVEEMGRRAAHEESRLQRDREVELREREREQAEAESQRARWADSWLGYALKSLPQDAPLEIALDVRQAVEDVLSNLTQSQPQNVVQRLVSAAVEKCLKPWRRQEEIELAVQGACKELPVSGRRLSDLFPPDEWEVRAMEAAGEAIIRLPADASLAEIRRTAAQAGKQVAMEYEAERARARAEQERQRREFMKSFVSFEVAFE